MPPRVMFQKDDIVKAALDVAKKKGVEAITAREVAKELNSSVGPIFTWFETMDQLKAEAFQRAKTLYQSYIEEGLKERVPFLGVWHQYIRFAKEEPELYKLLFLSKPTKASGGAAEALRFSQELARPSIMKVYNLPAEMADTFFRDIWLIAFSFATLIVTNECTYTDDEIFGVGAEVSLSVCKAYKEIPGLASGKFDRDAVFSEIVKKEVPKQ